MANGVLKPFEPAILNLPTRKEFVRAYVAKGFDKREAIKSYRALERDEVWLNDEYQVNIDKNPTHGFGPHITLWHVSIKRRDKDVIHDWRDLQAIKNMLCGEDIEAIELYPAESRLVDTANQFHLWAFMLDAKTGQKPRLPFGWTTRAIYPHDDANLGSRQRAIANAK
jgi:hypothetical protein